MKVTSIAAPIRIQVAASFRAAILSGRFGPGERLIESDLCDLTGASRTTVREALRQLETEGLVGMIPNKGPVVAVISADQARSIYEVREVLEGLAAALFVRRATKKQRALLELAVKRLAACYATVDIAASLEKKDAFYAVLLEGAGNEIISSTLRTIHARVALLRKVSMGRPDRLPVSLEEIQAIVLAIKADDAEAAADACRVHVRNSATSALGELKKLSPGHAATDLSPAASRRNNQGRRATPPVVDGPS